MATHAQTPEIHVYHMHRLKMSLEVIARSVSFIHVQNVNTSLKSKRTKKRKILIITLAVAVSAYT